MRLRLMGRRPFPRLFEGTRIAGMTLRNRIVMPAMAEGLADDQGEVTAAMRDYYEARARGGAALLIVDVAIDARGLTLAHQPRIDHDRFVPGLQKLAQVIQRHGAKAALQLHHAGPKALLSAAGPRRVGATAPADATGGGTHELSREEILELVDVFAAAAQRARRAGFDGLEVMAARGYLVSSFLSAARSGS